MKHFGISRWKLTGKSFVSTTFGFGTAAEAEASARHSAKLYGDQYYVRTVEATDYNSAKAGLK